MKLNLPILDQLTDSQNILIAGAGGGFDVFAGLPLYFTLREQGKNVHLANYTFSDFTIAQLVCQTEMLLPELLMSVRGPVKRKVPYMPEGFLSQWFAETQQEDVPVWLLAKTGSVPLHQAYRKLISHLNIDALILVDGGVDSIMRGDEMGAGTLVEDSITLAAVDELDVSVKILACLGFGTEVEEAVCHYHALANMAALAKAGAFMGCCALAPQMPAFQSFEAACRYVWEQPFHPKSHITTRVIPATHGEFGNFHMYDDDHTGVLISLLMSLYWFFDASTVIAHSDVIDLLRPTYTVHEAIMRVAAHMQASPLRPRRPLSY